jgi:hypothetical protein
LLPHVPAKSEHTAIKRGHQGSIKGPSRGHRSSRGHQGSIRRSSRGPSRVHQEVIQGSYRGHPEVIKRQSRGTIDVWKAAGASLRPKLDEHLLGLA